MILQVLKVALSTIQTAWVSGSFLQGHPVGAVLLFHYLSERAEVKYDHPPEIHMCFPLSMVGTFMVILVMHLNFRHNSLWCLPGSLGTMLIL